MLYICVLQNEKGCVPLGGRPLKKLTAWEETVSTIYYIDIYHPGTSNFLPSVVLTFVQGIKEGRIFVWGSCNQLDLLTSIFFSLQVKDVQLARVKIFSGYRDWSYFIQSEKCVLLCYILCEINKWSVSVITVVRYCISMAYTWVCFWQLTENAWCQWKKREEINLSLISEGIKLCAFCVNLACFS